MTEEPTDPQPVDALDPCTAEVLRALLAIDADAATGVRERSPAHRRPSRQYGPRLALGGEDVSSAPTGRDGSPPTGSGPGRA